jgi:hypothetical protein
VAAIAGQHNSSRPSDVTVVPSAIDQEIAGDFFDVIRERFPRATVDPTFRRPAGAGAAPRVARPVARATPSM